MKSLHNITNAPFEIGALLSKNKKLCGYLLDDSTNPAEKTVSFETLLNQQYINIYPPVADGQLKNVTKNTSLVLLIDSINTDAANENMSTTGAIYVSTDKEHILLNNNKNRLLEMVNEIYQSLEGAKLTSSGVISINYISLVMISEFIAGYRISFKFTDQQYQEAEI